MKTWMSLKIAIRELQAKGLVYLISGKYYPETRGGRLYRREVKFYERNGTIAGRCVFTISVYILNGRACPIF